MAKGAGEIEGDCGEVNINFPCRHIDVSFELTVYWQVMKRSK